MAGSSLVLTDDSRLSKIDQRLYKLEGYLALLSGLAVFSLMLLAVFSVGGRNLAGQPLPGYVDWIEQAMPLIAFMGIAFTQRDGGHIRMDMLVGALRGRPLYLAELITTLVILCVMLLLVWGSWAHFDRSFDFSAPMWSSDSSMDISLPLWPAKLLVPVAFSVLCLRLVLQVWAYGRALITGDDTLIAVPLVADAATQAAMEAEHVSAHDK
ncbi:TRAP transporter small permease [Shimia thalassica]|jgi:TRAP-type C4-dicarboxylate transport system permease small subunit|uniref:TRAP transporter small permease subunit n=1 Tax=Shimia thalassica TaxID=1715693 RepID=UPI000C06F4D1|nr:TRAP transporter small permease [Shimia thalassica]PHO03142.1 C4-dicarboxylate ABC transporter permease [Rhodobacteraceae bacterium 4F10]MBU2944667.1 TRAP transporter small permease [Shimia thalassica]MDO6479343.1 TRAP transporter small permease [Shimia thalassica]MDO6482370.1 TRAP transporter small permease [Shimia thalassica]MDO6501987.1 TRAP transporter small permease [Shimia thalassica]